MARNVIPFQELRMTDVEQVGGKNASLGEMISQLPASVRVPGGFATTADAYRKFLSHQGLAARIASQHRGTDVAGEDLGQEEDDDRHQEERCHPRHHPVCDQFRHASSPGDSVMREPGPAVPAPALSWPRLARDADLMPGDLVVGDVGNALDG